MIPGCRRPSRPPVAATLWSRRGYKKNGLEVESPSLFLVENLRIRPATSLAVTGRPRVASTWLKGEDAAGED